MRLLLSILTLLLISCTSLKEKRNDTQLAHLSKEYNIQDVLIETRDRIKVSSKNVSKETIKDATEPLKIKWFNDSFVNIQIWKD